MLLMNPGKQRPNRCSPAHLFASAVPRSLNLGKEDALLGPGRSPWPRARAVLLWQSDIRVIAIRLLDQFIELGGTEQRPPLARQIARTELKADCASPPPATPVASGFGWPGLRP